MTHELRTPLTTFRLYTEMLDEGMVAEPAIPSEAYLKTLRGEADRLGHLVENVLAFARLERGRAVGGREIVRRPEDLVDRLVPRLALRARQAGMERSSARRPILCQACASTFRSSIKSCQIWSIMRSSTPAALRPAHPPGRCAGGAMAGRDSRSRPRTGLAARMWSAGCSGRSRSRPTMPRNRRRESGWGWRFRAGWPVRWEAT